MTEGTPTWIGDGWNAEIQNPPAPSQEELDRDRAENPDTSGPAVPSYIGDGWSAEVQNPKSPSQEELDRDREENPDTSEDGPYQGGGQA